MTYYNYQILVHRPFLSLATLPENNAETQAKVQELGNSSLKICRESAYKIISLCQLYKKHYSLQCIVFIVAHFLLNVCTIHIADLNEESLEVKSRAEYALEDCFEILEEMGDVWEIAQDVITLVNELRESYNSGNGGKMLGSTTTALSFTFLTSHTL